MDRILFECTTNIRLNLGELGGLYAPENFDDFPSVKSRILDNVWDPVSYEGKHYGVPVTMLPFILAVNRDILSEHGLEIPQNWEELKAMGPLQKKHGIDAFTMPGEST